MKSNIIEQMNSAQPVFYLLNLIVSKESDKHATCLTIEYEKEKRNILLEFLDSNEN